MGKKDKNEEPELDKDSRKRLERLTEDWAESPGAWRPEKITAPDLRLLLEHFSPLQDLIRAIAATPASAAAPADLAQEIQALRQTVQARQDESEILRQQCDAALASQQGLEAQCRSLQHDLQQCSATTQKLMREKNAEAEVRQKLEKDLKQTHKDLAASRAALACASSAVPELAFMRQHGELARRLDLAQLPADDTQALIRIVAVLAQRDNLERLWSVLKECCEDEQRSANGGERALLAAAVAWYNHNWQSRPYRLLEPTVGKPYDFEQQQKSRHTPNGETLAELRLPGLADGSGKLLCKALVTTK